MIIQVTPTENIVNLFTFENLNLGFWKKQNIKELSRGIEQDKKNTIESIFNLPKYAAFVRKYENIWDKNRREFSELEKEFIERKYKES